VRITKTKAPKSKDSKYNVILLPLKELNSERNETSSSPNPEIFKERVISSISHELRTPINGLMGIFKMLSKSTKDNKILYYIGLAESNAKLLQNIVNSILDM